MSRWDKRIRNLLIQGVFTVHGDTELEDVTMTGNLTNQGTVETDGTYDGGYIKLGSLYIWSYDNDIYVKTSAPSSATDGEVLVRGEAS